MKNSSCCNIRLILILSLIIMSAVFFPVTVFCSSTNYDLEKNVSDKLGAMEVRGKIPVLRGLSSESLQNELNDGINKVCEQKKDYYRKEKASSLRFSYDKKFHGDYVSVIIYTAATVGSTLYEDAKTFVYKTDGNKILDINDVLGINGVPLVNKIISDTIKKYPDIYNPEFKGITAKHNFYIDKNKLILIFDKFEIASGDQKRVEIPVDIQNVVNVVVKSGEYTTVGSFEVKMIPLRYVCEGLGYTLKWDAAKQSTVISKNDFQTSVITGENRYYTGKGSALNYTRLEEAPRIIKSSTYAPISFFDKILGAFYNIDKNMNITFTQYKTNLPSE